MPYRRYYYLWQQILHQTAMSCTQACLHRVVVVSRSTFVLRLGCILDLPAGRRLLQPLARRGYRGAERDKTCRPQNVHGVGFRFQERGRQAPLKEGCVRRFCTFSTRAGSACACLLNGDWQA